MTDFVLLLGLALLFIIVVLVGTELIRMFEDRED